MERVAPPSSDEGGEGAPDPEPDADPAPTPPATEPAAEPAPAPAADEPDKGTPPEVSEAARKMAARRSELRKQVAKELVEEGELEADEVDVSDEADEPDTDEGAEADARPPTAAEAEKAEKIGPVSVENDDELPTLPPGFTWEKIPDGNPLRDRGDTHIPVAEGAAEYIRSQLNNPVRNRAVEEAQARARAAERKLLEIQAREKARSSDEAKELQDPTLRDLYEDIKEKYGEKYANVYIKGIEAQRHDLEEKSVEEVRMEEKLRTIADTFRSRTEQIAAQRYPEWNKRGELRPRLAHEYKRYGDYIDSQGKMPDVREFFQMFLDSQYAADPRAVEAMKARTTAQQDAAQKDAEAARQAELQEIKDEVRADLLKEAEEKRAKRADNPMGRLPPSQSDSRTPRGDDDPDPRTPAEFRKAARARAMGRVDRT